MMKHINLDDLEDLQDDTQEMMQDQEEIQEVLGRDYALDAYDEAELQQELDELDDDIVNEKLEGGVSVPNYMPKKAQTEAKKDSEELAHIMNN